MYLKKLANILILGLPLVVNAADKVDINSADAQSLAATVDGVGIVRAQAIVEHRETNGPFTSIDSLAEVKGIGAATVERNRDVLTVTTPE